MEKDCREYHKYQYNGPRQTPRNKVSRRNHDLLFMNKIDCFNCHKIGHMASDCNLTWGPTEARTMPKKKFTQVWRRKKIASKNLLNTPSNNTCC